MRKLASFLVVTADGYYEGAHQAFDWPKVDAEFDEFSIRQLDASDILLFGRKTYVGMARYWQTPEARQTDPAISTRMNSFSKIVISRTRDRPEPAWDNTRLIRGERGEIDALKSQGNKDLLVLGSSALTTSLMLEGQLDELRLMVNPIILGAGRSVFHTSERRIVLKLRDARPFKSGNVLLTYHPVAPRAAVRDLEQPVPSIASPR